MARNSNGFEKAQEYLKRHLVLKRWISVMLVVALLITTATFYAMNKAASAVTEEGADEIGMVLEENSGEGSDGGDDGVVFADDEEESDSEESYEDSDDGESEEYTEESAESDENSESGEATDSEEYAGSEENTENIEGSENTENQEGTEENSNSEENANQDENGTNEENANPEENSNSEENANQEGDGATEGSANPEENANPEEAANPEQAEGNGENGETENTENKEGTEEAKETEEKEITQDIVLKVSYVDEEDNIIVDQDENAYADETEVVLDESVKFPDDAAELEGYKFAKVKFDDLEITKVEVKKYQSADGAEYTYYEFISEEQPSYDEYEKTDDEKYVTTIKEDSNLIFIYEKEESEEETEDEENTEDSEEKTQEEGKITEENIPESVDLAEYVTETVIERQKEDGTWEVITESDIKAGDHLRITVKYSMPEEAALSDDIHMDVPEQYGNVISSESELDDGNGTYQATEDNKIIVNYSDEYKKEKLVTDSEDGNKENTSEDSEKADENDTDSESSEESTVNTDSSNGNTSNSDSSDENTVNSDSSSESTINEDSSNEGTSNENSSNENSSSEGTSGEGTSNDNAKATKSGSFTSALLSCFAPVPRLWKSFWASFTIVAHAEEGSTGNTGNTNGSLTFETIVDSADLGGMKITGVSVKKNPTVTWNADGTKSYSGGTEITSGTQVDNGETLIFNLDYMLEVGTVSEENPTITYALSKHGITVEKAISGFVYNSNNAEVGSFDIDERGLVTITFHGDFAKNNKTTVIDDSNFYFYATASAEGNDEIIEKKYDFGNNVTFSVIILNKKSPDLTLKKEIVEDYSQETGKIKYKITITTENGTGTDIQFNDWFEVYNNIPTNRTFSQELSDIVNTAGGQDVVVVKKKSDGSTEDGSSYVYKKNNKVYLKQMEPGETYEATYSINVPERIASTTTDLRLKNHAQAFYDNDKQRDAEVFTDFTGSAPLIKKECSNVKKSNSQVTWTITINEGHVNLKDYTLTDLIYSYGTNGWTQITTPYTGTLTVKSVDKGSGTSAGTLSQGSTITLGEAGYTFTQDDYCKYELTYTYTYSEANLIYGSLKNEARLWLQNTKTGNSVIAEKWIGYPKPLSKSAEGVSINDDGSAEITWKVTLNAPIKRNEGNNSAEYWRFYENLTDDNEVFTSSDLQKLNNAISNVYSGRYEVSTSGNKTLANGISGCKNIEIRFYGDITETVSFTYTTTGYTGDGDNTVRFTNKAAAYNKDVYAQTAEQSYAPFIKKYNGRLSASTSETDYYVDECYRQGILTWIIEANIPANNNYETLYIIDTLPEGVSLIENGTYNKTYLNGLEVAENAKFNGAASLGSGQATYNGVTYTKSGDAKNIVISFDGKAAAGKKIYFRVHAKIASDYNFASDEIAEFKNKVVISRDNSGNDKLGEASQTQKVTKTEYAMTKTSELPSGTRDTIEYVLDVNPGAADLLQGGDELTLTDVLTAKAPQDFTTFFVPDSAKVYVVSTDENGTETETELSTAQYSYTISSYETTAARYNNGQNDLFLVYSTVVFKIPDEKHLKIKYRYTFKSDNGADVELTNDAKLEGIAIENNSANNSRSMKISEAGSNANTRGINVYKVDAENSGTLLQGAEFVLYYYDGKDWKEQKNKNSQDGKYTTDKNGLVPVSDLVYNVGYKLEETKAPEGYAITNEPICFYISSADTEKYKMTVPDDFFTTLGGSEFKAGQPVYVKNANNLTSINIKKEWKNTDAATKPSSIFVIVKRRLGNPVNAKGGTQAANYYTVNIDSRNPNNTIKKYIGFPSVKSGSKVTVTFYSHKNGDWSDLTTVTENGKVVDYSGELNTSGVQKVTKTFTITGNTTIQIRNSNAVENNSAPQISAEVSSPDVGIDVAKNSTDSGEARVGAEDAKFRREVTITEGELWNANVTKLDKYYTDKSGITYEWLYYVSEVASVYYTAEYSDNNKQGINEGTITITNDRNEVEAYALPSTGGTGRIPFTIGGLALATFALIGEEYVRRKRRKGK
ncbi:SpaA isopeptide-forming pilin-related protein [Butyrivibrio sp. AC2005]|uniref:SpaA isopeptide-forming pilin-related protein n=1 Tax=Butyrivibrio sp. AC2005 TaxID=1280672 RepID=UPI0005D21A8C|nr:SpaA isopeptide-forming pilin-related protein [Butyrivibrio sp. AC2005]